MLAAEPREVVKKGRWLCTVADTVMAEASRVKTCVAWCNLSSQGQSSRRSKEERTFGADLTLHLRASFLLLGCAEEQRWAVSQGIHTFSVPVVQKNVRVRLSRIFFNSPSHTGDLEMKYGTKLLQNTLSARR